MKDPYCILLFQDVATEIIITLGQAFEVCYRIANGTFEENQPVAIHANDVDRQQFLSLVAHISKDFFAQKN